MSPHQLDPEQKQRASGMVAEIMEHAAERAAAQAAARQVKRKRRGTTALILLPILVALTGWNIVRTNATSEPFDDQAMVNAARMAVYVAAERVFAYRDSTGTLPATLATVGLDDLPVRYETDRTGFRMSASARGRIVSYSSSERLEAFAARIALGDSATP